MDEVLLLSSSSLIPVDMVRPPEAENDVKKRGLRKFVDRGQILIVIYET